MLRTKLTGDEVRAKDYFYALRAILAAKWIMEGRGVAPVEFVELLPVASAAIRELVPALLEHKSRAAEGERMPRIASLDDELQRSLEQIEAWITARTVQHRNTKNWIGSGAARFAWRNQMIFVSNGPLSECGNLMCCYSMP